MNHVQLFNYATEVYHVVAYQPRQQEKEKAYSEKLNAFDICASMLDIKVMFLAIDANVPHLA